MHGLALDIEIAIGEPQLPVGLYGLGYDFDHALAELFIGELGVRLGYRDAVAVVVVKEPTPERLGQGEVE